MTIYKLLKKGERIIASNSQSTELDCEILLSYVLRKDKVYLITHKDKLVSSVLEKRFLDLIHRRSKYEPISYIIGKKEFYDLEFFVNKDVLIPRPETETLVDYAYREILKRLKTNNIKLLRIIDVGTGSGNIGITLIHKIIQAKLNNKCKFNFYLTDISGKALNIAGKNYMKLIKKSRNIKVSFVKADLLSGFTKKFDIIISNPPYIPKRKIDYLDRSIKNFEPKVALNGGTGGFKILKRLILQINKRLEKEGTALVEIDDFLLNIVKYFIEENCPNLRVSFKKDYFGVWRFASIERN